jgi:putative ABC transport system permease protein
MHSLKLIFKNIFRHKLRSTLTLVGLVVAILAFGFLQTVVNAWYAGADMAAATRLVTRNATSLVFARLLRERIKSISGVNQLIISNWSAGSTRTSRSATSSRSSRWTTASSTSTPSS